MSAHTYRSFFLLTMALLLWHIPSNAAANDEETPAIVIENWLIAGPAETRLPAYHDQKNLAGSTFGISQLLQFQHLDTATLDPVAGELASAGRGNRIRWQNADLSGSAPVFTKPETENSGNIYYLAAYLNADHWMERKLEIKHNHPFEVYLNGTRLGSKTTVQQGDEDPGSFSHSLKLQTGRHLLVVKVLTVKDGGDPVMSASIGGGDIVSGTNPRSTLALTHLMDNAFPTSASISADGSLVAITIRESRHGVDSWENRIEIRRFDNGQTVATYRGGMQVSGLNWAPSGNRFSYVSRSAGKGTVWVVDLDRGTQVAVLQDVERLGGHTWADDGSFMVYSVSEENKREASGVNRLDGMHDRYPTWRNRSFLYRLDLATGFRERLTAGELSTGLNSISPDGNRLVYTRTHVDYSTRPFTRVQMSLLNLSSLESELLAETPWIGGASFSPDGNKLLITGSPNAFDGIGSTVEGLSNDYDTQAYIFDLQTRQATPITRDLDASVGSVSWSRDGRNVYITATDKSLVSLYRYDTRNNRHAKLDTVVDITSGFSLAQNADRAVFIGNGINNPHKVHSLDLRRDRVALLHDPAAEQYRHVRYGTSKDWTFTTTDGTLIDGHVYYPVDFNADKSYPVIVYYYGGTTPVTRAFSGRYPKELYAANGYIVYVLQPSGAIGYGQEFSQRHLNDWGNLVADEIIEGVTKFLDAHPYADRERVGAIGASYGGFMTMLLLTKTDIFAAAISHAGISNITSYWGDGFWGYLYSSVAAANSYPWDRPDVYVDQSPIFHADKVNTPLLLLHGMSDTNVPPAESTQFYTALKLLGKEVEYVQIDGQDHHIVDYGKFILWKNTIISWFDRWLKDQPDWWEEMY